MKVRFTAAWITFMIPSILLAQGKFLTNDGAITFFSHTAIEDITATHQKVSAVIDGETGEVAVIVKMTGFQFEKKLMQEHFNETYVESEKFPKATFNGKISNIGIVDYSTGGIFEVNVEGEMTIHGVTRTLSTKGTLEVIDKKLVASAQFYLNPEDYDIKIPGVVRNNIAEQMKITLRMILDPI
jgi:polyisoprenoid-binding protein YceI